MMAQRAAIPPPANRSGVRRNLFHQHLSRRPTSVSASTSTETLRLDAEPEMDTSDIVVRDKNGDFDVGDALIPPLDDQEESCDAVADIRWLPTSGSGEI